MKFKFLINKSYWFFLIVYVVLIVGLVHVEKDNPNSNIKNLVDGFWYSVVTLTTVGYGDFYPVTPIGKILGLVVILSSIGVLGFLIGNFTNIIQKHMEKKKKGFFGTDFSNHFVIIGWDDFANNVANQIINANSKIAIITDNITDLEFIKECYSENQVFVLFSDYKNIEALTKANIKKANSVFVNFSEDTKSLIYVINFKKHFDINVVVALQSSELKETFKSVGVNHIILKNEITSRMVASYIFEPDVAEFTEELMETSISENDFDFNEYKVIGVNPYLNMDYMDAFIDLKKKYNTILIGITKIENNKRILLKNPSNGVKIELNDYVLIICSNNYQKIIENVFGVKEGIIN